MAVKNCEELSNIIALSIVSWDEDLANEISRLSEKKKDALMRAWKLKKDEDIDALTWWSAHELELKANSADIEMRAIVQAKILSDEVRVWDAYRELAEQIKRQWGTIAWWVELLEKLRKASPSDLEDIAKQWWWTYADDPVRAVNEMKQAIAENISANYSIRQYSEIKGRWMESLRKQLRNWDISQGVFEDEVKKIHKEAMEQIAKWENPNKFVKLDEERDTIKKVFWDDPVWRWKAWSQFIMARELLSDWAIDDWVLKAFEDMWAENLTWELTKDQIAQYWKDDLDKLLARAYTNTEQLYKDGDLRQIYREKLVELTAGMRVSKENMDKAKSIMRTMEFADKWATFSDIVTADNAARSARKRGLAVNDWNKLLWGIKSFAKKMEENPDILKDPIKIAGVEMKPIDLIQIVYDITWDENILRLLRLGFLDNWTILSVGTTALLWWNKEAADKILRLFSKAKEAPKVSSVRDISLMAITWTDIKEWAKVGFFDFRKSLYRKDELNRAKADFMDKLAEKNKMRVDSADIKEIKDTDDVNTLMESLNEYKWWYIVVNDSQWRTNTTLSDAIDNVNKDLKDEEKIWVISPRWWLTSNFSMEDWQLFFKTIDDEVFRDVAGTISIQTLWETRPTREILATAFEAATGKNGDKIRYQPSYTKGWVDSEGRAISDQQYEYFLNSKVRDENWNLIRVYHWTYDKFDMFNIDFARKNSDIQWMFFSEYRETSDEYWPDVIECYLNITNPAPRKEAYEVFASFEWQNNRWVLAREELQRRWYDWVQSDSWEWIAFSPEQIKYVDNKVPTSNPDMRYSLRDKIDMLDTYVDDDSLRHLIDVMRDATWEKWLFFQRDRFNNIQIWTKEFWGTMMDNVLYRLNTVQDVIDIFDKYWLTPIMGKRNWYMREILDRKRGLDKETINWVIRETLDSSSIKEHIRFNKDGTIKDFINDDWWVNLTDAQRAQIINRLDLMWDLFNYVSWTEDYASRIVSLMRDLWIPNSANRKNIYENYLDYVSKLRDNYPLEPSISLITKYNWQDFDTVLKELYDDWYYPFEFAIEVDGRTWKVKNIMLGNNSSVTPPNKKWVWKVYHNHPNATFFSTKGRTSDLKSFRIRWGAYEWLILPWWVIVEFKNDKNLHRETFKRWEKQEFYQWQSTLWNTILDFIAMSAEMGVVEKQHWWAFSDIVEKYLDDIKNKNYWTWLISEIRDRARWIDEKNINNIIDYLTPAWETQPSFMRRLWQYTKQTDVNIEDAMKVQLFTKDRTWQQIADAYGFPVKVVEWDMIEWVAAYWAWGNWMIYFTDMVKESTAPHELFHAIFNTYVGKDQYDRILSDATKLFQVNELQAEEILADSFAEWFRTWKFTYWDKIKAIWTKKLTKEQKTFLQQVKDFFIDLADTLWLVDKHRAEVEQMFNDMVNCQYLPDAGKNVNATEAMMKYNNELNATAARYFWEMLWEDAPKVVDNEYIQRVQNLLGERLWIDIKTFDQIQDKSALWQKINQQFALEKITTWKYDRQVVDINAIKNKIASLSDDELEKNIKNDLWDVLIKWNIKWNKDIDHIREAYLDYQTAGSAIDSLTAKWKIVSLANGWTAQTMSIQEMRDMFTNWTFEEVYKKMFLSNQTLSKKDMETFISAINNNIFDTLSITFVENLVDAWYSLPLMNVKSFIYEYLRGNIDLNNKFVEAFLYKNNIPFTQDWLKTIVDMLMPAEFKFDYENALFKWRFDTLERWSKSVVIETKNKFLQDSYSAIAAVEMAKAWDMSVNYEEDILKGILDKYVKEVYEWVKNGTLTFQESQWLKQEAGYALDMFEQDFLLPRYGRFLSKQERQWLMWMKYQLPIWVKWQNPDKVLEELTSIRNKITQKYQTILWSVAHNNDINMSILKWLKSDDAKMQKAIDERRQQLIDNWWIIREVNWQYLVYDVKQALAQTIAELPSNIWWLEWIKALWRAWIEWLSSKQAYALLRYLEAAKGLNSTANLATDLIYKQNPRLLQYNFFQSYKVGKEWIPVALEWNLLNMDKFLSKYDNISWLDTIAKKNIFDKIVWKFRSQWYITTENLDNIIDDWVAEAQSTFKQIQLSPKDVKEATNRMKLVYRKVFEPYVHVRDIPKWGTLLDWKTTVRNIKKIVADTMKQQYNQAVKDLEAMGIDGLDNIQTAIYITTNDWEKISLQKAWEMNIDSWKKNIFNDESVFVAWADELKKFEWSPDDEALVKRQKEWRNEIISQYDSNLRAMLNQTQYITDSESWLMTAFMNDVRTSMRQYTLTNKIVDALDALSGLNEEAARWIKDYLIWWKWNISFGKWKPWQILKRNKLVQEAYTKYYAMDISKLNSATPSSRAEDLALRLAKYFKNLERLLGSADWLTWCTTSAELNRAFFHIWEVVKNIDTVKWVFWLLSWVEQNQVLKFFKFAKWDLAKQADVFIRRGKWTFQESVWWYRDYVEEISWITRDEFNEIFAANFSEWDFKRILQWLTWFTLTWDWWGRTWQKILNVLNSSNFLMRFLMSYPWQLLTIPQQSLAYFLKQIGFEKDLWIESMSEIDAIRSHYWILDWAYNEIVLWWKSNVSPDDLRLDSYYNRYWIPDVDEIYKTSRIETSDDYINMYAKIDNHAASSISATNKWFRQLDPYKDNANNIIDGLFSRNFKNIAFIKAIKNNDFLRFGSAKELMSFMDDPTISAVIKTKLMDEISSYSGRNFRNILWLGFWWIDRAVSWYWFWNIMYWLMQLLNFRWSWWQNIFKQTWANLTTALKMLFTSKWAWSREWREAMAEYIARQPEFTNFIWALFNDLKRTWKLQRFQDNWRRPDDDSFYDGLDFIEYITDTLNMTSQWFQWLQSFWPLRPIMEAWESAFASHMNPTIYKDTYWVWAFFNALGKNVWRQRKPYNWLAKWAWAWTTDGSEWALAYLESEFWKLSFGSLRYMVNEDQSAYGYTYEITWQTWWIPSILMWESKLNSDKNFSYEIDNTETWETLWQVFNWDIPRDSRWTYLGNLGKTFINWSQLVSLPKNVWKAIKRDAPSYFTADDLADTMQKTDAWLEFYRRWIVTPKTPEEAEIFFNTMLENAKYRPWSSSFTKSLIQYEDYWHMNGKETWNKADAEMELWLSHMKYLTNEHWEFETQWWEKVIDPSWNRLIEDIKTHWYDSTYTTNLIYNYSKTRLNNHSSDPNYQLYIKMLGQWQAHNLIEYNIDQVISASNKWKKWKDNKWIETELKDVWLDIELLLALWNTKLQWEDVTLFDKLQVLDEDDATVAALQIIQKQAKEWDKKVLDRFFDVKENDDWSKSVSLKYQYESTLKQIWAVAKALDVWDVDLAVAEASTLVNMYKQKDPTWAITATLIDSVYNRIYDTDSLSPSQKQAAMIALFHKNKDYIQRNPEKLREVMWDAYDVYANYMNQLLYQWDWMVISNLESMQSSWKSSSWSWSAASKLSSSLKKLATSIWWSPKTRGTWGSNSYKQWVPVVIKWASLVKELWLKGYTPSVTSMSFKWYKPHVSFEIWKDINRNVKTTKTQTVSTSKQLSNIEKKTTQALEAES